MYSMITGVIVEICPAVTNPKIIVNFLEKSSHTFANYCRKHILLQSMC